MPKSSPFAVPLLLLWLVGVALRLPILAVPPVIPVLRSDLGLSGTEIGILSGLPAVLFAAAALLGSLLIARVGLVRATIIGLLLTAAGCALRAGAAQVVTLFAATIVMGAGVAVTQPAMPTLVRSWLPDRIGLATGIYTNGLLMGEIFPVALFPVVFPLVDESWRGTFVLWAVPIAVIAVCVAAMAPRDIGTATDLPLRWWPDWRSGDIWRGGLIFASANTMYFASNAFLPGHLSEAGRSDLISAALTALNVGQLPSSLLLMVLPRQLMGKSWPFVVAGVLGLASIAGIAATSSAATVVSAAVLGFAAGGAFALGLTLPPLLSGPEDIARLSAAMFTISYTATVVVSVLCGIAWDVAGNARFAFLPMAFAALPAILVAPSLKFGRKVGPR